MLVKHWRDNARDLFEVRLVYHDGSTRLECEARVVAPVEHLLSRGEDAPGFSFDQHDYFVRSDERAFSHRRRPPDDQNSLLARGLRPKGKHRAHAERLTRDYS